MAKRGLLACWQYSRECPGLNAEGVSKSNVHDHGFENLEEATYSSLLYARDILKQGARPLETKEVWFLSHCFEGRRILLRPEMLHCAKLLAENLCLICCEMVETWIRGSAESNWLDTPVS